MCPRLDWGVWKDGGSLSPFVPCLEGKEKAGSNCQGLWLCLFAKQYLWTSLWISQQVTLGGNQEQTGSDCSQGKRRTFPSHLQRGRRTMELLNFALHTAGECAICSGDLRGSRLGFFASLTSFFKLANIPCCPEGQHGLALRTRVPVCALDPAGVGGCSHQVGMQPGREGTG